MARILVVDDERSMRELLEILLAKEGHAVSLAETVAGALEVARAERPDVVITDLKLGKGTGLEVLEQVKRARPEAEVIMITAYATTENAIQAMKLGAYDYLQKPFKVDELLAVVGRALERRALVEENLALRSRLEERERFEGLVGRSQAMREVFRVIEKVAPRPTTVLITGESGVGKELVARAVHTKSPRASGPFVAVNCGAIPEGLLESELFGHVTGAFTGASTAKPGLFLAASQGTLFLDEIGELPMLLQVKLLRVLQERRVKPVGGVEDIEVDARIIAATNKDLEGEVKAGRFREDLFYRLNVIQIKVPPLRERREDVLVLAGYFLKKFAREHGRQDLAFSRAAMAALTDHPFPGNVRELENAIERGVTLAEGAVVELDDLPASLRGGAGPVPEAIEIPPGFDLERFLEEVERRYLERALYQAHGVKLDAAKLLGVTFRSFRYRASKLLGQSSDEEGPVDEPARP